MYVGDEHRIQEFAAAAGAPEGEISLASISPEPNSVVVALAVAESGAVFVAYRVQSISNVIYEFEEGNPKPVNAFPIRSPSNPNQPITINAIADSSGRLAVAEEEGGIGGNFFGSLYTASTGHLITEFTDPGYGLAFGGSGESEGNCTPPPAGLATKSRPMHHCASPNCCRARPRVNRGRTSNPP